MGKNMLKVIEILNKVIISSKKQENLENISNSIVTNADKINNLIIVI